MTYNQDVSEFALSGNWKLIGYFQITGPLASVNGQLCRVYDNGNYAPIQYIGGNICNCYVCGYSPLVNHYSLKDLETGKIVNVGSECLAKIIGTKKADHVKAYVESTTRKITSDFKRPIKNEDLKAYVKQVYDVEKARDVRKARILKEKELNPELYKPRTHDIKGNQIWFDTEEKRTQQGIDSMNKDINFWINMKEHYLMGEFRDFWNPDTMIRAMKKEAEKDGLSIPKFRKLTESERTDLNKKIEIAITEFIEKLKLRNF